MFQDVLCIGVSMAAVKTATEKGLFSVCLYVTVRPTVPSSVDHRENVPTARSYGGFLHWSSLPSGSASLCRADLMLSSRLSTGPTFWCVVTFRIKRKETQRSLFTINIWRNCSVYLPYLLFPEEQVYF